MIFKVFGLFHECHIYAIELSKRSSEIFRRPFNTKSKQPRASIPHASYLVKQRLYADYGLLSF